MLAEQVALAAHGLDARRVFRVVAEFAAQPRNACVDRAVEAVKTDAAQFLQQIVARQDVAGVAGKQPEQVEFGRRQVDGVRRRGGVLRVAWLMRKLPKEFGRLALRALSSAAARCPARGAAGLDARQQQAWLNRLGDVVVGTQFQAKDLVEILVACGEHQDHPLYCARTARQTSKPSLPGSMTSRITRSGSLGRMRASAVSPRGSM
jgi:hypothetical protein